MNNLFEPKSLTIKEIFGDVKSFYKIPRYQRPYRWEDDQVEQLWDDVFEAFEVNIENYFLGSIIVATDNDSSYYCDVVDGQQRLTTLTILLCVVRDLFPSINQVDEFPDPYIIDNATILNSIYYNNNIKRLKLNTHAEHQNDFETLIVGGNTAQLDKPAKSKVSIEEKPQYKFINTAAIFRERFMELGEEQTGKMINYLFNNVFIIRIDCKTTEFAIRMFQVLNDRGLDLTNADLVKSFLFEEVNHYYGDNIQVKKNKEDVFVSTWQDIELITNDIDMGLNDMLVIYNYFLHASNPKKSLYDELQKEFKGKNPLAVVNEIKQFIESYRYKIYESDDKVVFSLWYLRWSMYWKSIVNTALVENYSESYRLIKALRRFYYLNWIAGRTLTKVKQISFNLINWIKEDLHIDVFEKKLEERLDKDKTLTNVREALASKNVYNTPWIKPLLLMIEYNQTDSINNSFIPMTRDLHVEHVLPIGWEKIPEWRQIIDHEIADTYLDSIGNLTLLLGVKNIRASSNPFDSKIEIYKGKGKYPDSDTRITSFYISQKILNNFLSNTYNKEWNKEAMKDRWNWFLEETEKVLDIDLSSIRK